VDAKAFFKQLSPFFKAFSLLSFLFFVLDSFYVEMVLGRVYKFDALEKFGQGSTHKAYKVATQSRSL
jgi:hypothetical protein